MKLKILSLLLISIITLLLLSSCTAVKSYQKINLNDPDMELSERHAKKFETTAQVYREGASGANGGKSGGGCGCN